MAGEVTESSREYSSMGTIQTTMLKRVISVLR